MLMRNGCPRCNGFMHIEGDEFGFYETCITCGYTCDLTNSGSNEWRRTKPVIRPSFERDNEVIPFGLEGE